MRPTTARAKSWTVRSHHTAIASPTTRSRKHKAFGEPLRDYQQRETLALVVEARAVEGKRFARETENSGADSPAPGSRLPLAPGRFIGRESAVHEIASLANTHRAIGVTGPSGIGKTQTALHAAVWLQESGSGDAAFVDLTGIGDAAFAAAAIATAAGLKSAPGPATCDALVAAIGERQLVLVVDGCDRLDDGPASVLRSLLAGCSGVRVLATSPQPLGNPVGKIYSLLPLASGDARALFVERAASRRAFDAGSEAARTIADICSLIGGIPGAIELAAARADTLSLATIAQTLGASFARTGGEAGVSRERVMHATVEWSEGLLNDTERKLFRRLGAFAGTFDAEAGANVCGEDMPARDVAAALSVLAHMSLAVAVPGSEPARYRLTHSARDYATERLQSAGDRERLAAGYARYFCNRAASAPRCANDLDNYRAVLHRSLVERRDVRAGAALAGALEQHAYRSRADFEGRAWVERALAESAGDSACAAWALVFAAERLAVTGSTAEALHAYARAREAMNALPSRRGAAIAMAGEAIAHRDGGNLDAARVLLAASLGELRATDDADVAPAVQADLAELEFAGGDPKQALALAKGASDAADFSRRCVYRLALGQLEFARADARKALQRALRDRSDLAIAIVVQHFAVIEALAGELRTAARLRGYVDGRYGELAYRRGLTQEWSYQRLIEVLQNGLRVSEIVALAAQGAAWSERRAILEATHA